MNWKLAKVSCYFHPMTAVDGSSRPLQRWWLVKKSTELKLIYVELFVMQKRLLPSDVTGWENVLHNKATAKI